MAKKIFLVSVFVIIGIFLLSFLTFFGLKAYKEAELKKKLMERKKQTWMQLKTEVAKEAINFQGDLGILIKDLNTDWEISFNKEELFPAASLVKIPIMAACFQAVADGKISLQDKIILKGSDKTLGSGILKAMPIGAVFTIDQIVEFMVTRSDNTASNIMISLLGYDYLNNYFKQQGLKNTNLSRKMMDFRGRNKGVENFTSVRDISFLLENMYDNKFINSSYSQKCLKLLKMQKVKDRIPKKLPENAVVAHKTGLEKFVCHDAGIVFTKNGDFLICVLTKSKVCVKNVKDFIAKMALNTYNKYQ